MSDSGVVPPEFQYSRTDVYAPFSIRGTPVEPLNFDKIDVKSRQLAGLSDIVWGFETTSISVQL